MGTRFDARGPVPDGSLGRQYEAYCRTQARAFLSMIPREGVRPLYARARSWAIRAERYEEKEPLETLVRFVLKMLPLPPFEVWVTDFEQDPYPYLRALEFGGMSSLGWSEPATLERRAVRGGDLEWMSSLKVYQDDGVWRGFISFDGEGMSRSFRTTDVFCESDAEEVRNRYFELTDSTLEAFLRSVLS